MRAIYILKGLSGFSGDITNTKTHLNALISLLGEDNVLIVDLSPNKKAEQNTNYIAYGKYKTKLARIQRIIEGNVFYLSNKIISQICEMINCKGIEFAFVGDSTFGRLTDAIERRCPNTAVVTFYHDVKAELFHKLNRQWSFTDRIERHLALCNERITAKSRSANIVLNRTEAELLSKHYDRKADFLFPVCVKEGSINNESPFPNNGKRHIIFVGTSYTPNIIGINWFYQNVFKKIHEHYDLWILGRGLETLKNSFDDADVYVIGFTKELAPYYCESDVVIAPLTDGGGMKIKTAESLAYGKVFVGSAESLCGYFEELPTEVINKLVFRCDSVKDYIKAFEIIDRDEIKKCNDELRNVFREKFSEEASCSIMKTIIERTTGRIV